MQLLRANPQRFVPRIADLYAPAATAP